MVPHLNAPQNLQGLSPAGQLSLVHWPHQCEVIRDRIEHIDWTPPRPEPLYTPTGLEMKPSYQSAGEGTVIYLTEEANKDSGFVYSRVRGLSPSKQILHENGDNTLIFEARFESGNLQKVVKVNEFEYQLTLRTDLYTSKYTQWYYFQVSNTQAGMPYRFTIVNFSKPNSLYKRGMRPLLYSEADAKKHNVGWRRTGNEIKYYRNSAGRGGRQYFSLTWTFQFPHNRDTCYFAHCYPYTYSNLQDYLVSISKDPVKSKFCKIHVLCHSLARNIVYVLTITNPHEGDKDTKRKAVILTARVHPGETNSSWIMKGFLDYILGNSGNAQVLRDNFVFKVIPMLNPDGVIVGNHRCSLAGQDLNRKYKSNLKEFYPSIWYTRNMIKRVMEERDIILYCDLHGHNRKKNVFVYGCERKQQAKAPTLHPRVFPLLLSKICPDKFSFPDCRFKVQKSKEGTGRVVMWKMGISNSYTLEASICGSKLGQRQSTHFNTKDLESVGHHFCDALLDYCVPNMKYYLCLKEHEEMVKQQAKLNSEGLNSDVLDRDSSQTSDSSDSCDLVAPQLKLGTKNKPKTSGEHFHRIAKERSYEGKNAQGIETFQELDPVGRDFIWNTVSQSTENFISPNPFLSPTTFQKTCHASGRGGVRTVSACRPLKTESRSREKEEKIQHRVKLPITTSVKQAGGCLSSKRLPYGAESIHEKPSMSQEPKKSAVVLATRENFHSSSFNLISQKMKKLESKSVCNSSEKTFQYAKGHDSNAKSSSSKEERKMKERLSSKATRPSKNKTATANQDVNFKKNNSDQIQNALQFFPPLLPEAKGKQSATKYQDVFWNFSSSNNEGI
ncbi:cytosolic carboxypeptidase 3 isoform X2 [Nothoprocta perdicaria]|uniref:cytosolic carboxypeptidase 3 isoform X2 n=1 Tax=Nothoprocta perdicaria TaxID=30464 RepID=UPI000E1BCDF9|nr:cytosolic carboxypeptidase 3 isoform X2 [Nothoprocta perdicaria]